MRDDWLDRTQLGDCRRLLRRPYDVGKTAVDPHVELADGAV
jgi:hypothetical protein